MGTFRKSLKGGANSRQISENLKKLNKDLKRTESVLTEDKEKEQGSTESKKFSWREEYFPKANKTEDIKTQIEESKINELSLNKARMTLVDKERSNFLLQNMENPIYEAGGSAANTAYWISQLGGEVGFIGKISNDELGNQFQSSLKDSGLKDFTVFEEEDNQTGLCAIFITPDGERTMNTYLGAGEYLSVNDLNVDSIKDANICLLYTSPSPRDRG